MKTCCLGEQSRNRHSILPFLTRHLYSRLKLTVQYVYSVPYRTETYSQPTGSIQHLCFCIITSTKHRQQPLQNSYRSLLLYSIEQYLLLKYTVTENGTEKKLTMCAQRATCPWTDRRDESGTFGIHSSPPRHQIPVKELCLSLWQTEGILLGPPDQKNARLSKTIGSATENRRNLLSKVLLRESDIPSV